MQRLLEPLRKAPRPVAALGPDDILLNPGASWNTAGAAALTERLRRENGFRLVVLVYDLIPVVLPQYFKGPLTREFRGDLAVPSAHSADLLLAISRSTRRDAIRYADRVGVPPPPVEVIRLSDAVRPPRPRPSRPPRPSRGTAGRSSCASAPWRSGKNHLLLYHVWRRLVARLKYRAWSWWAGRAGFPATSSTSSGTTS